MAKISKTWWGQNFMAALEEFTDAGRLSRGRSYASDKRILKFEIKEGLVKATVRGNVNPYFGVYEEPRYTTKFQMTPIAEKDWHKVVTQIGNRADLVSKLLMNEMPDDIDAAFRSSKVQLLPHSRKDFKLTDCSCPDYENPCKHIAGVYYRVASLLDQDPFLLFELRGLSRELLQDMLRKSPLGEVLSSMVTERETTLEPVDSYYPRPCPSDAPVVDYNHFWRGQKRLPNHIEAPKPATVPGILVKKAGDYPPFWHKDASFIEVMEEFYVRVRTKNKGIV